MTFGEPGSRSNLLLFHQHRRAVAEHFSNPGRNLSRIVTNSDHRIRSQSASMCKHLVEGIVSRSFAKAGIKGYISPEQTLNARPDISNNGSGSHNDSTHHAKRFQNSITGQVERSRR